MIRIVSASGVRLWKRGGFFLLQGIWPGIVAVPWQSLPVEGGKLSEHAVAYLVCGMRGHREAGMAQRGWWTHTNVLRLPEAGASEAPFGAGLWDRGHDPYAGAWAAR